MAYLIATFHDIQPEWLEQCSNVGVTAGASTPEVLVQEVVQDLIERGFTRVEELDLIKEDVHFPLPDPSERFETAVS